MKKLLAFCLMVCCAIAQAQLVTYPEGLNTELWFVCIGTDGS